MVDEALELEQPWRGSHQQPALIEMNFRHDGFNKRDQKRAAIWALNFKEVVPRRNQILNCAQTAPFRVQPDFETDQIEQMEFTLLKGGSIVRMDQEVLTDQGLRCCTVVDAFKTNHKQRSTRQLAAADQFHFLGRTAIGGLQPARARLGEALGEITAWVDFELSFQPLRSDDTANLEPVQGIWSRHDETRPLCR